MTVIKATTAESGCWVDSSRGWRGRIFVVRIAHNRGMPLTPEEYADYSTALNDLNGSGWKALDSVLNDDGLGARAEKWLNEHVAPPGYAFGWDDGEFYLWDEERWERASGN